MSILERHLLAHTNGRLGMVFANQQIEVVEVIELDGDVNVAPTLEGEAKTSVLEGSLYVDRGES